MIGCDPVYTFRILPINTDDTYSNKIFFINLISVCGKYEKIHDEYNRKLFKNSDEDCKVTPTWNISRTVGGPSEYEAFIIVCNTTRIRLLATYFYV